MLNEGLQFVSHRPSLDDMKVFVLVIQEGGFSSAAQYLNSSPAYVSKRIAILEQALGVKLFYRGARSVTLTAQGKVALNWAKKLLEVSNTMVQELRKEQVVPTGVIRIVTSSGFGRAHIAPLLSQLSCLYPQLEIDLELLDRPVDIITEGFDLEIRTGETISGNLIARKLYSNNRILCASPEYVQKYGEPKSLLELKKHRCILIRERERSGGRWLLHRGKKIFDANVSFFLQTNSGEVAQQWCLDGRGIMLRSVWSIKDDLAGNRLVHILPDFSQDADFYAIYPSRLDTSAKLRVVVNYIQDKLSVNIKEIL